MKRSFLVFLTIHLLAAPLFVLAQASSDTRGNQMRMTLTPPLIQIGLSRGTEWKSSLRFVNSNPYPLTIYARVVPFTPDGETGNALLSPFADASQVSPDILAGWISIPKGPIDVSGDSTGELPLSIRIPENAPPGGHYAAVLVGTEPGTIEKGKSGVAVGSMVTSLILVRVPGEVIARESFLDAPEANFIVRFENKGNVHVVPQGEISIRNMWGKERGKIIINESANFGNVLPNSTRKFEFVWKGEENAFEFGRYTAVATLTYGEEGRKSVYRETAFWVIPWKPISIALLVIVGFFWFASFAIRRYIRRAIDMERERLGVPAVEPAKQSNRPIEISARVLTKPVVREVGRLRREGDAVGSPSFLAVVRDNPLFFL
jgi:hypothetical protein